MFYSSAIIYLAAQAFSTAALSQLCSCFSLATSQNQSQAQIHTSEDFPVVDVDQSTSHFALGELACLEYACTKTSLSAGGGAQTQPQQEEEETTKVKSKVTSQSSDEDDYIFDESGCPELTKNMFYCEMCGGSDENGKCKGVSGITIILALTEAHWLTHALTGSQV
jgi:maleate cis-trans isomerase